MTLPLLPALAAALLLVPVASAETPTRPTPRPELAPEPVAAVLPLGQIRPRARPEARAQAEPVRADCLAPETVADADLRRNAATIAKYPKLCIETESFTEHGLDWQLVVISNGARRRGPTLILLHDNEDAAFDTALYGILKHGGRIVAVEAGERRDFQRQDPNRNFGTSAAATASCRDMRVRPAPLFTERLAAFIDRNGPVITLHNNDDGYSGGGGQGTISARRQSAVMTGMMTPSPAGRVSDEDNAVLLAGTRPFAENREAQTAAAHFQARGINVIYEHVRPETSDCSLSNYVVLNRREAYYNIEAEHGDAASQRVILDALMDYVR